MAKKFSTRLTLTVVGLLAIALLSLNAQPATPYNTDVEISRFDFGKMWTFEHAPTQYFQDTYGFQPDEKWWERARLASLKFASWCSASFISPDGLILTNHHCSRGEVFKVQKEGEDFENNGFYAPTRAEERQIPGLFVKQLARYEDITDFVNEYIGKASSDEERLAKQQEALKAAEAAYAQKDGWEGLELETVTFYSGGKYSIYGYKRYDDIRLVLIPELQLGYFGGDPDNFTYPRYNLDMTIWRAYENGQPVNTSAFYFPVNPKGPMENEAVFTIGNPGSTERYRTVAQLEYDRDYRYKILVDWMNNRINILQEQYAENPSPELLEQIFELSNSAKAIGGIEEGLNDPTLMGKKWKMEQEIKSKSQAVKNGNDYWAEMASKYEPLGGYASEITLLPPNPMSGAALQLAFSAYTLIQAIEADESEEALNEIKQEIKTLAPSLNGPYEVKYLATLLGELKKYARPDDTYVNELLDGRTPEQAAKEMLADTRFANEKKLEKLLEGKPKKLKESKDPIIQMGQLLVPEFQEAAIAFRASSPARQVLSSKIANEVFNVYGVSIPPDATFTQRIADGWVKGYPYNGTEAPFKTTYFGLYDRYYANDGEFPWELPDKWLSPPSELLKSPLNYVATCDIIGGNSGSPMINTKGELVGLIFDGNIESLPGNFIYDVKVNRSVAVHAGGITAALKYIYRADRLLKEMGVE